MYMVQRSGRKIVISESLDEVQKVRSIEIPILTETIDQEKKEKFRARVFSKFLLYFC